jgi:hypothetical protein
VVSPGTLASSSNKTDRRDITGILLKVALNTITHSLVLSENNNITKNTQMSMNHIGGVMVSVLASSVVDRGFEPQLGQIKDYKIGICCFSAKHAALRRKNTDWLARNQNNVSE